MTVTDFGRPSNLLADILIWRGCDSGGSSNQRVGVWSSSSGCMSSGNFLISAPSVFKWLHEWLSVKNGALTALTRRSAHGMATYLCHQRVNERVNG